jgi:hypothetical protein
MMYYVIQTCFIVVLGRLDHDLIIIIILLHAINPANSLLVAIYMDLGLHSFIDSLFNDAVRS